MRTGGGSTLPVLFNLTNIMKNLLYIIGLLIFGTINAQIPVYINSFDSVNDVAGWTFHDLDGNGNQWVQGKNWYSDPNNSYQTTEGTADVLRYSNGKLDNTYVPNMDLENNWIISPEIDLEGASGLIQLAVDWRLMDTRQHQISLDIYISESPDLANFETLSLDASPYVLWSNDMEPWASDPNEFSQTIMDISTFAGKKIYIGLKRAGSSVDQYQLGNLNINEIGIYADSYMAASDTKAKASVTVYPNPATDVLYLKGVSKANAAVYSTAGQLVSKQAVTNGQLNVSALPKGVYTLSVEADSKVSTTKFIKK